MAPRGAAASRAASASAGAVLPRRGTEASQAASRSPSRAAVLLHWKRGHEGKADRGCPDRERPTGPRKATGRWARSWLHAPTRCATRSLRARTAARSARVAGLSGTSGRSRARSVRSVSASTNASNRSSFAPEEPYRPRRFFTWPGTDHHHGEARRQQGINQHPVAPLDRYFGRAAAAQPGDQPGDPGPVVHGSEAVG